MKLIHLEAGRVILVHLDRAVNLLVEPHAGHETNGTLGRKNKNRGGGHGEIKYGLKRLIP